VEEISGSLLLPTKLFKGNEVAIHFKRTFSVKKGLKYSIVTPQQLIMECELSYISSSRNRSQIIVLIQRQT